MVEGLKVLCFLALWQIANVQAANYNEEEIYDPRNIPRINSGLKEFARYHCYHMCYANPDNCSKEAKRDMTTCENFLYWSYWNNYIVCRAKCATEVKYKFKVHTNCTEACLKIGSDKIKLSPKTPDQLIRAFSDVRDKGIYIE